MSGAVAVKRAGKRTFLKWHRARRGAADAAFTRRRILEGMALGASVEVDLVIHADDGFAVLHDLVLDEATTGQGRVRDAGAATLRGLCPSPVHSAHVGQYAVVHYPWHALFGRRVRIERSDVRTTGRFVHVEVLPGVVTVVAAWMLDASACVGMEIGAPRVAMSSGDSFKTACCPPNRVCRARRGKSRPRISLRSRSLPLSPASAVRITRRSPDSCKGFQILEEEGHNDSTPPARRIGGGPAGSGDAAGGSRRADSRRRHPSRSVASARLQGGRRRAYPRSSRGIRGRVARHFVLSSGDARAVETLAAGVRGLRIGYDPCHDGAIGRLRASRAYAGFVEDALAASPDAGLVYLDHRLVFGVADDGFDLVAAFHAAGRRVDAYTIERADPGGVEAARRLLALGVDQITTDDAEALAAALA